MAGAVTDYDRFSRLLATMQRGAFDEEVTQATEALVAEMARLAEGQGSGKPKGSIQVTISFVLDRGMLDIAADLKVVRPKPVRARTIAYPGRGGKLLAQDPQSLGLEEGAVMAERQAGLEFAGAASGVVGVVRSAIGR